MSGLHCGIEACTEPTGLPPLCGKTQFVQPKGRSVPSRRSICSFLVALSLLSVQEAAHAELVVRTPRTSFAQDAAEISFGHSEATYRFVAAHEPGYAAIATGGTALVASYGPPFFDPPRPAAFTGPGLIADDPVATYLAYPDPVTIPFSNARIFLGLEFTLQDGVHFGYAEIAALTLVSYAFETRTGQQVIIGADPPDPPAVIPEPKSVALLASALAALLVSRFAVSRSRR